MAEAASTPLGDGLARVAAADELDDGRKRRRFGWFFWLPVGWLMVVAVTAGFAPWLGLAEPDAIDFISPQLPPSADHWFPVAPRIPRPRSRHRGIGRRCVGEAALPRRGPLQ